MEKFNRAVRRHHAKRLKKTRRNYWGVYRLRNDLSEKEIERFLGKVITTPVPCACTKCNVPRRLFGKSFAELRLLQDTEEGE